MVRKKSQRAYLVLRCNTEGGTVDMYGTTVQVLLKNKEDKVLGMCPVVSTKKRAHELSDGGRYEIVEIRLGVSDSERRVTT